ncbi:MAG TPA: dTMP kinase [Thermotoga sp.]|nr:dTMP kinase [Thermotoga sp.]
MLITFEGIDGCGKTTQVKLLSEYLKKKGIKCLVTREPGGTMEGEKIREILMKEDLVPLAELFLFLASRVQHVEKLIIPALRDGKIVLVDRFIDSSVAYQGFGRGIGEDIVRELNDLATKGIKPDLTFYIDIDVDEALKRKKVINRFEEEKSFLEKVRKGYLKLSKKEQERIVVINGSMRVEEVHRKIVEEFEKKWRDHG